mmetsp:Transcript_39427/g.104038  ORF Transcript_39427/g.104038 Transcript_39427/m.104038 type:complete len:232 (-) Transcript_39427:246-941(-)
MGGTLRAQDVPPALVESTVACSSPRPPAKHRPELHRERQVAQHLEGAREPRDGVGRRRVPEVREERRGAGLGAHLPLPLLRRAPRPTHSGSARALRAGGQLRRRRGRLCGREAHGGAAATKQGGLSGGQRDLPRRVRRRRAPRRQDRCRPAPGRVGQQRADARRAVEDPWCRQRRYCRAHVPREVHLRAAGLAESFVAGHLLRSFALPCELCLSIFCGPAADGTTRVAGAG